MKKYVFILILSLAACTGPTLPVSDGLPDANVHPIDLQWEACYADTANHNTYGMIECETRAMEAWKEEMQRLYLALLDSLDPEPKEMLQKSQEAWLQYFRAEAEFSTRFFLDLDGTIWHIEIVSRQRELYRQRASDLNDYARNNDSPKKGN